jgi:hypothetical protein
MEIALLLGLVAVTGISLVLVVHAFTLAKNLATRPAMSPAPRWFLAGGAFVAAAVALLFLIGPGFVPWWTYAPSDDAHRILLALGGGALALLAIGLAKFGNRNRYA